MNTTLKKAILGGVFSALASSAYAAPFVLTFEGLGDNESIADYYNGGVGGKGSGPGPNYGITFGSDSLALISDQAGGSGNFDAGTAPSGNTIAYFQSGTGDVLDLAAGFTTGFSFYYGAFSDGTVSVYSGLDGSGTELATLTLAQNVFGQRGDTFTPIGVTFLGTAQSVVFSGSAGQVAFDNITIGSATAMSTVPLPASAPMFAAALLGLAGLGYAANRKKVAATA